MIMWNIFFLIVFGMGGGYIAEYNNCYWWSGVLAGFLVYILVRFFPRVLDNIGDIFD